MGGLVNFQVLSSNQCALDGPHAKFKRQAQDLIFFQ